MTYRTKVVACLISASVVGSACDRKQTPSEPTPPVQLSVRAVFPNSGTANTRTTVHITGTGFQAGLRAELSGVQIETTDVSSTSITANTPALAAGTYSLTVTNPNGERATLEQSFAVVVMSIASITPTTALPGAAVRVTGSGFPANAIATVDGAAAKAIIQSTSQMFVLMPFHPEGVVELRIGVPGNESATALTSFTYQAMTLTVDRAVAATGSLVNVSWVAPPGRDPADWVGLFKVGAPNEAYEQLWWDYTNGTSSGSKSVLTPLTPGQYEFRYFVEDGLIEAARSAAVTVNASGAATSVVSSTSASHPASRLTPELRGRGR